MKLYKLNFLRLLIVAIMVISYIPGLLGMEKDEKKSPRRSNTKTSVNSLLIGDFPTTPFYHFTRGRKQFSLSFMVKRSNFIRRTFCDIYRFSDFSNIAIKSSFPDVYGSMRQCFVICQNCDHPATSLFRDQKNNFDSFLKNRSVVDVKKSVKDSFERFFKDLEPKEDIDSIDLYLMGHLMLGEFTQEKVLEKTKKLSELKRDEIAIYYLMNFAFADLIGRGYPRPYYRKAKKLGCAEARAKLRDLDKHDQEISRILNMKPQSTPRQINMLEDSGSLTIPL